METQEIIKAQAEWNNKTFVLLEMVKQLNGRYLSIMKLTDKKALVRYLLGYTIQTFKASMDRFDAYAQPHRLYYDLAVYDTTKMPMMSFNLAEREKQRDEFNKNYNDIAISMDMPFDFDAPNIDKWKVAWKQCGKLKQLLDRLKTPYSLRWSGAKGFHIVIPWYALPKKRGTNAESFALELRDMAEKIKKKLKLNTLDLSIYDLRRILKLPYSLDGKSGLVCLPLTNEQFSNFNPEMMQPEEVLDNVMIKNRGLLFRTGTNARELWKWCGGKYI